MTLHVDDGRNFLLMNRKKYDVITADIILPRHAGAGSLYSREYYELVRNALADDGLAMQWNGGDSETEYKLLLRTFLSVFPHTTLWGDGSLMLGSTKPFTLSQSAYEARRVAFEQFQWDLPTLKRIYVAGPDEIRAFVGDGPVLTDDKPVIEYFLSLPKNDAPGGYTRTARARSKRSSRRSHVCITANASNSAPVVPPPAPAGLPGLWVDSWRAC